MEGRHEPYRAPIARFACALWTLSFASLTYAVTHFEEGTFKTVAVVLGGTFTFGGLTQVFQARPLAPGESAAKKKH
jgi:hypothetical protein